MLAVLPGDPAPLKASSAQSPAEAAAEFLRRLPDGSTLLVAVSGGSDSTGLLVMLADYAARSFPTISIIAATVDHGLRPEAAAEARSVARLCAQLGVPHATLAWQGEKPKTGVQANARRARYRLLADHAAEKGADLVVTAHTLDDQQETLAMRRARSDGPPIGISEAVLFEGRLWVCRPLLRVRREAIRAELAQRGITWTDDPSNENEAFERVRVRRDLETTRLPVLQAQCRAPLAREAARFLQSSARVHGWQVAEIELPQAELSPARHFAILYLAAVIGGRSHVAGREVREKLRLLLETGEPFRFTAERVLFDRRKNRLYLSREERNLPHVGIPSGGQAVWDSRFRICNERDEAVTVVPAAHAGDAVHLLETALPDTLPRSIRARMERIAPALRGRSAEGLLVEPVLAPFAEFLPIDLAELADALAIRFGMAHFPKLPSR